MWRVGNVLRSSSSTRVTRWAAPLAISGLVAWGSLACGPAVGDEGAGETVGAARAAPPVVWLITLDTTRADALGCYGGDPDVTPHLDALAAGGTLFERAWTTAPITLPAHTSMLSGLVPARHGVRDNGLFRVADEVRLLPEALAEQGWRTGAFVSAFVLDARYGLDQGFEVYGMPSVRLLGQPSIGNQRGADEVVDEALHWLDGLGPAGAGPDEPVFLWTHFFDPHANHAPPEPWASRFADPYLGEVAFVDDQIGRLRAALSERAQSLGHEEPDDADSTSQEALKAVERGNADALDATQRWRTRPSVTTTHCWKS